MSEWQPIETAPRDGTWFMICCEKDGCDSYEIGRYDPMPWVTYAPVAGTEFFEKVQDIIHEWRGFNNMHRATHWAPVPAPPGDLVGCPKP